MKKFWRFLRRLILLILLLLIAAAAVVKFVPGVTLPQTWLDALPEPLADFLSGSETDIVRTLSVYRVNDWNKNPGGTLIQSEACAVPAAMTEDIPTALSMFMSASTVENLSCAMPDGVAVIGWSLDNGIVTVELSEDFLNQSDISRTLASFCLTLTLCELENVKAVTIVSGDRTLFSALTPDDAILSGTDTDPYVRQLRLYFADPGARALVSEYHSLTLSEETSPERYVVEELLRGPNADELQSVLPAGTELLSCTTEDGVCTVDLSSAFLTDRPKTAAGERLAIYSLVDSLTALSGVDSVQILVEGEKIDKYVCLSLTEPFEWYDAPIAATSEADMVPVVLYAAAPDLSSLAALPAEVDLAGADSAAQVVLTALINLDEPGYPMLYSGAGLIGNVTVTSGRCTVDLSDSFFVSLPEEARDIAVRSMAATLCALEGIESVSFTVAGADAVFDGEDYSGPWVLTAQNDFDGIEVY